MFTLLLPPSREKELPPSWGAVLVLSVMAVFLMGLIAGLIWYTGGSVLVAILPSLAIAIFVAMYRRLDLAVFLIVFLAIWTDQLNIRHMPGAITGPEYAPYYENLKNVRGLNSLTFLKWNIFEMHYAFVLLVWTLRGLARGTFQASAVSNARSFMLFFAMVAFFFAYGTVRGGGDFLSALWEVRALFYMVMMYMLLPQILHTRRHIHIAMALISVAVAFKAWQGLYRYFIVLGANLQVNGEEIETVTGHEDAPFIAMVFVYFTLLLIFKTGTRFQRWFLGLNAVPMFICFVVTQRRVAYGAMALALVYLPIVLPADKRRIFIKPLVALALAWFIYYPLFKNSNAKIGMLAQQMKTVIEQKEEDASAIWRDIEMSNLKGTLRQYPWGIGFGQKYLVLTPQPAIDFELWNYIPHNAIFWIWVKTGWGGFMVFWYVILMTLARTLMFSKRTKNPYFKVVALTAILAVCMQMVVSYYDLQLTYYRNMILLGTLLALVETARCIDARSAASTLMIEGRKA